jgi:hypothetical protein
LKIVPSEDIGQLGPQQGKATIFDWKWYYSTSGFAIWLLLIPAFAIPKKNRDIRALLILVPLVVVNLLWWLFMKFAGMNSTDAQEFSLIFHSMAVGITVLWLITNYLSNFRVAIRFLLSFVTVMIVAGVGILSYTAELSKETAMFMILFILMILTMLGAITLSRWFCSGKYRPVRFMLWLVLWTLICSLVATFGLFIIFWLLFQSGPVFFQAILMFIVAGSVFGLWLYVLNFPFMILGFISAFYRERFCACLYIKPVPVASKRTGIDLLNKENLGKEMPEKRDSV